MSQIFRSCWFLSNPSQAWQPLRRVIQLASSAVLLKCKILVSEQPQKSVWSSVIAIRRACSRACQYFWWMLLPELTISIFHTSAEVLCHYRVWHQLETQQQRLCKSAHTWLQQLCLFGLSTHKSPFWFMCIRAVLPFKYGCSSSAVVTGGLFFTVSLSQVWSDICATHILLITGEQPEATPCASQQLHSLSRGEGTQHFWPRVSVADSFLTVNPALWISASV